MAGVGRRSDFGKPDYDTNADEENRLDTTDPLIDWTLPYEERVKGLMDRGMTRAQAVLRLILRVSIFVVPLTLGSQ